jgi:hypothetical protein
MSGRGITALAVTVAALLGTLAIELNTNIPESTTMISTPRIPPGASPEPQQALATDHADDWVAATLARPLFSPDRRPPLDEGPAPAAVPEILPRLTGVLVSSSGKTAFFAGDAGGKPIAIREGDRIATFTVQVIAAGQVTITGPGGKKVLTPVFDQSQRPGRNDLPAATRVQTARETTP